MPVNEKQNKKYSLEQSPLHKLWSRPKLARLLALRSTTDFKRFGGDCDYRTRPQPDRPEKTLTTPNYHLKLIQRRIKELIGRISTPDYLFSGVKGRSYIKNAAFHKNGRYILTVDVKAFYESCDIEYVFRFWRYRFEMPEDLAWLMARICTYKNHIPRGSSHGQLIAFWAYEKMFDRINRLASDGGCNFTLYVDDMAFSSQHPISKRMVFELKSVLREYGLDLHRGKTKFFPKNTPKLVTGCIIQNGELRTPNKRTAEVVRLISELNKAKYVEKEKINSLRGKINSIRQIEKHRFVVTYSRLSSLRTLD